MPRIFKYEGQIPFWRVDSRSQIRNSYCDNTTSASFDNEDEAVEFAEKLKGRFREVLFIYGKTNLKWKFKIVAKWGIKKTADGRRVVGRIK